MSTPMLTSFVSNNNETPTNKKQAAAHRINSAPIRTLTTTTKFSSTSFNNLKQQQQQATKLNQSDPLERFTVDYVIKRGYFNLVRYLLTLGLDPNHVSTKESYPFMYTPLIYCTFVKDEKWALSLAQNLLERGADLKKTDNNRLNPIHYCCAFGLENLLKLFLESVDFDLSRALDVNGNNCMHYAIRSHNLNCVKLIIDQFKPNDMYKRIDIKNSFGLRPSQLEDEMDFSQSKYFNYKFNGKDSLEECKQALTDFIREYTILRTIILYKPLIDKPVEIKEDTKTSKASKSKKRSGKLKTKKNSKSSSASSDKSEFKSNFFQTEIEPIIEETKPNTAATSPKPRKKSSRSSKKDSLEEKIIEPELKIEPVIQQPEIIEPPVIIEEKTIDKEKAKQLTVKSFKINLRERLGNLITFNEVFVSKEHMFKSILNTSTPINEPIKLHRSSSLKPSLSRLMNGDKSDELMSNETVKTWKTQLPNMFLNMECLLTPSYRETVHPLSSSPNLFKRSLKKSSKKSSSNLDASLSRPNSILKRQQSAVKTDRKNSVIQKINENISNE